MANNNLIVPIKEALFEEMIEAVAYAEGYPGTIVIGEGVDKKRVENTQPKADFVVERIKNFLQSRYERGAKAIASNKAAQKVEAEISTKQL